MTYLWINPVSERMISAMALEKLLKKHDLTRVVCQESWGEIVLRKYLELLEHADGTFADARTMGFCCGATPATGRPSRRRVSPTS